MRSAAIRSKWVRLKEGDDWGHVYYCVEPLGGPTVAQVVSEARKLPTLAAEGMEWLLAPGRPLP